MHQRLACAKGVLDTEIYGSHNAVLADKLLMLNWGQFSPRTLLVSLCSL